MAVLRLARPPVNALDLELVQAISSGVTDAVESGARALVVTAAGSCFSAGIDMKVAPTYDAGQRRESVEAINTMVAVICSAPLPVVAAVNGHAFGGGLVIALACDLRVAAKGDYKLALNEVAAGVPFPPGPLALVRAELDPSVVRDLCLTGRSVGPEEALALRLLDEIVEAQELLRRARERVLELAAFPAYPVLKAQVRGPLTAELKQIAPKATAPARAPRRPSGTPR
ncbi:MAG TPA: enoyl-CoA hydratase/isomerase family protein [Solirubrobacteraceae bacterium]|nr:enoyl-CoA hydratase/isomerase family protein [Solirubrobacteraceae bacterium]